MVFDVYVGSLFVTAPSTDAAKLLASDTPRRQTMHFLRQVKADAIVEAWRDGFKANSPAADAGLKRRIDAFLTYWRDMKVGDEAVMTYVPGTGTSLTVNGKAAGPAVPGKDFADAILNNWIGPTPSSPELKRGILGK